MCYEGRKVFEEFGSKQGYSQREGVKPKGEKKENIRII
jgi:hypothetical protein